MYSHLIQKIDRDIGAQLKSLGIGEKRSQKYQFPCITISRQFGCEGVPVALKLIKKLSTEEYPWVLFHRELITELSESDLFHKDFTENILHEQRGKIQQYIDHLLVSKPTDAQLYKKMAETLRVLGLRGRSVILGAGAALLTSDIKHALHVRLQAPIDFRVQNVIQVLGVTEQQAREEIAFRDNRRLEFIYEFTHKDVRDPAHYHLVIDNEKFKAGEIAELIYQSLVLKKMLPRL
ncbi:cytidylate kinase-like family protein [Balneolales bacterium ANBcel1]|nr:cytidylate kinase-like family protein [Balneolales bacterium ANBcel1]